MSEIMIALQRPFPVDVVSFKPQVVKGNRALAVAFIDARDVQNRLDEVFGPEGWQDEYEVLPNGSVICRLSARLDEGWVTKSDVGSPSDQPDVGDKLKAAFSDSLKRAGIKWGIGRYLYSLGMQWRDFDPVKKQFTDKPQMPAFAIPTKNTLVTNATTVNVDAPRAVAAAAVKELPPQVKLSAQDVEIIEGWKKDISQTPAVTLGRFNTWVPDIAGYKPHLKAIVWDIIVKYADERGWFFNKASKSFDDRNQE